MSGAGAKPRVTLGGRGKVLECYHYDRATWYFAGIARASRGEFEAAKDAIQRAHSLGLPAAETDRLLAAFDDATPWYHGWEPVVLDTFGAWIGVADTAGGSFALAVRRSLFHHGREPGARGSRAWWFVSFPQLLEEPRLRAYLPER